MENFHVKRRESKTDEKCLKIGKGRMSWKGKRKEKKSKAKQRKIVKENELKILESIPKS